MISLKNFLNENQTYVKWPFHFGVEYGSEISYVDVNELTHNAQNPEIIIHLKNGSQHRLQFDLNDEHFNEVEDFIKSNFGDSMRNARLSNGRKDRLK